MPSTVQCRLATSKILDLGPSFVQNDPPGLAVKVLRQFQVCTLATWLPVEPLSPIRCLKLPRAVKVV